MRKPYSAEASVLAYQSGIRQLAPLVDRIRALEAAVKTLTARLDALEQAQKSSTPVHLAKVERR
jgi:hypothetical protein